MKFSEVNYTGSQPVDAYGPGFFRLGETQFDGPLLLLPNGLQCWSGLSDLTAILEHAAEVDVVFFGMGDDIAAMPQDAAAALTAANIAFEVMATPPACRSYNMLLAEGRRVGLAAFPVQEL
ncbi:Mth938-like domain-containing protein [Halovulum sp. GXIMD14793]